MVIRSLILDDENPKGVKTIIVITQEKLCSEKNALYSYEKSWISKRLQQQLATDKKRLSEGLIMAALKSTCKHVIHYSHYSLSDVVWTFSNENFFLTLMYQYSRICIRIYDLMAKKICSVFLNLIELWISPGYSYEFNIVKCNHRQHFQEQK